MHKLRTLRKRIKPYRRKALVSMLVLLLIVASIRIWPFIFPNDTEAWHDTDWNFRKKFTIDSGQVDGSSNHTNFPVMVNITDPDLTNKAQSDGDDIFFILADGTTKLDHEIEEFDSTTGTLVAWVEIPSLSYNTDTEFYMYYGNPNASSQQNATGTWKSTYEAVWHMSEASSATRNDSTDGGLNLTNGNSVDQAEGISGYSADFNSSDDDYLTIANASAGALNVGNEDFYISLWVKSDYASNDNLVSKWVNNSQESYRFHLGELSGVRGNASFAYTATNAVTKRNDSAIVTQGEWVHLAMYHDSVNDRMGVWVNGILEERAFDSSGVYNSTADFYLGRISGFTSFDYNGLMDEVRFMSEIPDDDWVTTENNMMTAPASFYSEISAEEQQGSPVSYWKFDEATDNTCPDGTSDVCDSTQESNDGAMTGGTWQSEDLCVSGSCMYYDGSDDVTTISNHASIDFDDGLDDGWSFGTWVRANSDGESNIGEIFNKGSTYLRVDNEGADGYADLEFNLDLATTDANVNVSDGIILNRWHYVEITHDGTSTVDVYIDGLPRGTDTGSGTMSADSSDLLIGGSSSANFHGFVDESRIYDYERSESQAKSDAVGIGGAGNTATFSNRSFKSLSDGLVGYWKLDESSGNATDYSGNGTTLTNNSSTAYSSAKFGNGAEPDGSADYFEAADNQTLSITGDLTLSAWIEPDNVTGTQFIVGKWDGTNNSYMLALSGDELRMYINSDSIYETTDAANLSGTTMYHVIGVYNADNQTVDLYVNGSKEASTTTGSIPSSIDDDTGEIVLGADDSPANYFDGHIDESRIYNRALSRTEVPGLYTWGPSPVGYWNLDENTGTSTAYDKSGNSYNITLTSAAETDWVPGKFGSGLTFDGTSDYGTSSSEDGNYSIDNYSVSAWINRTTDSGGIEAIVDNRDADNDGWLLSIDASDTVTCSYNSVDATSTTTISTGSWYHIGCTTDGTDVTVYVDGVEESSAFQSGSISETTDMRIGIQSYGTSQGFAGIIDDIRVYNYARTPSQIVEDMNGGHPLGGSPVGSPAIHLKFDELSGDTANNSGSGGSSYDFDLADSGTTCPQSGDSACPTWNPEGKINGTLSFDDDATTDDFAILSDPVVTDYPVTMSAWVKTSDTSTSYITTISDTSALSGLSLYTNPNLHLAVASSGVDALDSGVDIVDGEWHHVAAVFTSATDRKLYLDGTLRAEDTDSKSFPSGLDEIDIGRTNINSSNTGHFDGEIDEVKIYAAALTDEQIRIDMNASSTINFGSGTDEAAQVLGSAMTDPIAYWPMDENTGTSTTYDKSGNGYDATMNGTMTSDDWVLGKFGSALDLDGSDDNLDPGTLSSSTIYTVAGWYKLDATGSRNILHGFSTGTGDVNALIYYDNASEDCLGYLSWNFDCYGAIGLGSTLADGDWHHVVYTYNDSDYASNRLWFDGVEQSVSQVVGTSTNETLAAEFDIGANGSENGNWEWNGQIDEVKVWDYELTQAQVSYEYNRGAPVGWWRFDECTGTTLNDASNNTNNGTWSGASGTNTSAGTCSSGTSSEAWNNGTTGKYNASLDFDGTDDRVTVSNTSEIDIDEGLSSGFTFSAWINTDSDGLNDSGRVFSLGNNILYVSNESGSVVDLLGSLDLSSSNATTTASGAITLGQWHHVAMSYTDDADDEITIWIDGLPAATSTNGSGSPSTNVGDLNIGYGTLAAFDGKVDDFRIYNYELTQKQIQTVMNHGAARFD